MPMLQVDCLIAEPRKRLQWRILLPIGLGILMTSFESSAVVSILPRIGDAFHGNIYVAKWVVTLHALTMCTLLLAAGRLGDLFGHCRLYLMGLAMSFMGAFMCSIAASIGELAFFRIVSGIGAVLVFANAAALLTKLSASTMRGYMLGLLSTAAYLGLILGPAMSGFLSSSFGWQAIFIAVMVLAAIAFVLGLYNLPNDGRSNTIKNVNILETLLIALALGAFVLAFHSGRLGWQSLSVISLLGTAFLAIIVIVLKNRINVGSNGYITVLVNPKIALAIVMATFSYIALYSINFAMPFYLSGRQSLNSAIIGLILSVRPAATAIIAPLSGKLTDRFGSYFFNTLGILILLLAFILLALVFGQPETGWTILSLAGIGAGMGIFLPPNHNIIMSTALPTERGVASAILSLSRNLGMLIGVGIGSSFFSIKSDRHVYGVGSSNPALHSVFLISAWIASISVFIIAIQGIVNFIKKRKMPLFVSGDSKA